MKVLGLAVGLLLALSVAVGCSSDGGIVKEAAPNNEADNQSVPDSSDSGLQVGDTVTILNPTGDSIRLRVTPSMTSVTFATVPNGSSAVIMSGPTTAEGRTWYEIETSEGTGFTESRFLTP